MITSEKIGVCKAIMDLLKGSTFVEKYRILLAVLMLTSEDDEKIELGCN